MSKLGRIDNIVNRRKSNAQFSAAKLFKCDPQAGHVCIPVNRSPSQRIQYLLN